MPNQNIRFNDGAAYDRMMGTWSRMVGEQFIDWLAPSPGLIWADIGCGTGAFCELLAARCAPRAIHGIDPSMEQLAAARAKPTLSEAEFRQGNAMALPYPDASMDAAVMALVLFFVPEPARGVAEMVRVVKPGGSVSAYMWDSLGAGSPSQPLVAGLRAMGQVLPDLPSETASSLDAMRALWTAAGLESVEGRTISVRRTFDDFETFWSISTTNPRIAGTIANLTPDELASLRSDLQGRLPTAADGTVGYGALANAIKGRKPGC